MIKLLTSKGTNKEILSVLSNYNSEVHRHFGFTQKELDNLETITTMSAGNRVGKTNSLLDAVHARAIKRGK